MSRPTRYISIATLLLSAFTLGSIAQAGIGDATPLYTVPGVLQTASLATVFHCTNVGKSGSDSIAFGVDVYDSNGVVAGSASAVVAPGETRLIATQVIQSLVVDVAMTISGPLQGAARILGTAKLECAAYVMSPYTGPGYMNALPIISKLKQRGQ
jgi:hypothetical protein